MHYCDNINRDTKVNHLKWRENYINCRQCKRNLVLFVGNYFLNNICNHLQPFQVLCVAGCFNNDISQTAWYTKSSCQPQPEPDLFSNAEETDSRIWLHAEKTSKNKILVLSPDTDVYHIGLPLHCATAKEILIQLSPVNSRELKTLNITSFISALKNDPDLAEVDSELLPKIMQTIYISTGCDYVSFFSYLGKSTFLKYFFQYSSFITASKNASTPGMLSDTEPEKQELGYFAFLRLVGVAYFKKHASGFSTTSPEKHFDSLYAAQADHKTIHFEWLKSIRTTIWERVKFENEMLPSDDALLYHWKRTCWIANMWKQADYNIINVDEMVGNGWVEDGDNIKVQWDSDKNRETIKQRVANLMKGCSCKAGCRTARCGCKKRGEECREGCACKDCENVTYLNSPFDSIDAVEREELFGVDKDEYEETMYQSDDSVNDEDL